MNDGSFQIIRFHSFDECISHIHSLGAEILGVEIHEHAVDVEEERCFTGNTVLIMGNEATGLNPKHASKCDRFIRISQYGGGTASLNVYVAASIVMHRFQLWLRNNLSDS
jgi:tRNA G18 (ribose-2'-O)-methylase SpoU